MSEAVTTDIDLWPLYENMHAFTCIYTPISTQHTYTERTNVKWREKKTTKAEENNALWPSVAVSARLDSFSLTPHETMLENISQCFTTGDMFKNSDILEWLVPKQDYIPLQRQVSLLQEASEALKAPLQPLLIFYHAVRGANAVLLQIHY